MDFLDATCMRGQQSGSADRNHNCRCRFMRASYIHIVLFSTFRFIFLGTPCTTSSSTHSSTSHFATQPSSDTFLYGSSGTCRVVPRRRSHYPPSNQLIIAHTLRSKNCVTAGWISTVIRKSSRIVIICIQFATLYIYSAIDWPHRRRRQ